MSETYDRQVFLIYIKDKTSLLLLLTQDTCILYLYIIMSNMSAHYHSKPSPASKNSLF